MGFTDKTMHNMAGSMGKIPSHDNMNEPNGTKHKVKKEVKSETWIETVNKR